MVQKKPHSKIKSKLNFCVRKPPGPPETVTGGTPGKGPAPLPLGSAGRSAFGRPGEFQGHGGLPRPGTKKAARGRLERPTMRRLELGADVSLVCDRWIGQSRIRVQCREVLFESAFGVNFGWCQKQKSRTPFSNLLAPKTARLSTWGIGVTCRFNSW